METANFLKENRNTVINYFNNEIRPFWNISLKDFMLDLMNNFKKVTQTTELKKFDLMANLSQAKSRLGLFDVTITSIDKKQKYNVFMSESSERQLPSSMR